MIYGIKIYMFFLFLKKKSLENIGYAWIRMFLGHWIRIRTNHPDPDPRTKKSHQILKMQSKKRPKIYKTLKMLV